MMLRTLPALFALVLLAAGCERPPGRSPDTAFEPGQVWTYWTRAGEEGSRVIVCRVEDGGGSVGQIVHIHVTGLRMKKKDAPGGQVDHVPHMPYSADALRRSVRKLEATGKALPPSFEEDYHQWRT